MVNTYVQIVDISQRPGVADITIRVLEPPSRGTRYLLVVRHSVGYQYKGDVRSDVGEYVVEADLRLASPGSWREFFVVRADADASALWEATIYRPIIEMPKGTRELTGRVASQIPE